MLKLETPTENNVVRQALDGMCIGLVTMAPSGRVSWMNRAACRTLGVELSEARGQLLGQVLKDPQLAGFWQAALDADAPGALGEVSTHWPHEAHLKVNATTARSPSGELVGRALVFCDVTTERMVQVQMSREATERLMGLAGQGAPAPHAQEALTPQELRVLRHVGGGLSNQEIAAEMGVAMSTVRSHLKRVYRKLELPSRSAAIRYALQHGLA